MAECGARQVNSRLKMQKIAKKTLAANDLAQECSDLDSQKSRLSLVSLIRAQRQVTQLCQYTGYLGPASSETFNKRRKKNARDGSFALKAGSNHT
jgi:hypothetical protein